MKVGDIVSWKAINGMVSGVLIEELGTGHWLVATKNGRNSLVNESSIQSTK